MTSTKCKRQLLDRAADVFDAAAPAEPVDLAPLHTKIGQLALENEYELPTAALRSSQATQAAVDNSASIQPARSLFISWGKSVQTSGATSLGGVLGGSVNYATLSATSWEVAYVRVYQHP